MSFRIALVLLALVLILTLTPSAATPAGPSQGAEMTLRQRVKRLEIRVRKLEADQAALRVFVCLQLPTC